MVHAHLSTPEQRAQWTTMMLAHQGEYGLITRLSRTSGVSRPTLYAWRAQAAQALRQTFAPTPPPVTDAPIVGLERQVLTLLVDAHATQRGIQTCLRQLLAQGHSLPTLTRSLPWVEDRAGIREWRWAVDQAEVLDCWVCAAGGRIENGIAVLPLLPHLLASLELRRMLRQSGIEIREGR